MMRETEEQRVQMGGRRSGHSISIDGRERVAVTGVEELLGFSDMEVSMLTTLGTLTLEGEELHIERLNLDEGQVIVRGLVYGATYDDNMMEEGRGGLFGRIFRR
ncbi:sporulation protein [Eubacteriales bacterium OttesenSCG-928-M02]|nr:sporulation protein [Eubacteriales bacterium OttesenSCG-928-M02]